MDRTAHQILRSLGQGKRTFWELMRDQDATIRAVAQALAGLEREGRVRLEGARLAADRPDPPAPGPCPECGGRGVREDPEVRERADQVRRDRPREKDKYYQGVIDAGSVAAKAAFLRQRGDLHQARLLLLGDDDLLGLSLASAEPTARVTVVDIDEELIAFVARRARELSLDVRAEVYDVRRPLPAHLKGAFDAFVTEPPEAVEGLVVFLSRGVEALAPGGAMYLGLSTLETSLAKLHRFQREWNEMGLAVTDVVRNFTVYPESDNDFSTYAHPDLARFGPRNVTWYRTGLVRAELVGPPRPLVTGDAPLAAALYLDEETWDTPRLDFSDPGA